VNAAGGGASRNVDLVVTTSPFGQALARSTPPPGRRARSARTDSPDAKLVPLCPRRIGASAHPAGGGLL